MKNAYIHINRRYGDDKHTLGNCNVIQTELPNEMITVNSIKTDAMMGKSIPLFSSVSLERGWLDNKPNVSCIPTGEYYVVYEYSPAFNRFLWEIYGVEGRSECKFHIANYYHQLQGCIALGLRSLFLNDDLVRDLTRSKDALDEFHIALKPFEGKIIKLIVE